MIWPSAIRRWREEIEVLAYVREPATFVPSWFQHRVLFGAPTVRLDDAWPGYRARFEPWVSALGHAHSRFPPYDRERFDGRSAVRDVALRLGLSDVPDRRATDSHPGSLLAVMYAFRRLGDPPPEHPGATDVLGALSQALGQLPPLSIRWSPARLAELAGRHDDDVQWMTEHLDADDAAEFLRRPAPPLAAGDVVIDDADDLLAVADSLLEPVRAAAQRLGVTEIGAAMGGTDRAGEVAAWIGAMIPSEWSRRAAPI